MKRPIPKPTRSAFLTPVAMILTGLLLGGLASKLVTDASSPIRGLGSVSGLLIGVGIGGLVGSYFSLRRYRAQSPEEQREADRGETDERNVALRGRAALVSTNATTIALGICTLVAQVFDQELIMWLCAGLLLVQWASFFTALDWYDERM